MAISHVVAMHGSISVLGEASLVLGEVNSLSRSPRVVGSKRKRD